MLFINIEEINIYIPPHFKEVRESEIFKIIENFPLATIVCDNEGDLIANHIPLIRLNKNTYIGHIAKSNSLHLMFPNGVNALAIFTTENSYISPNWYLTNKQSKTHVPTWNYQTIHLKGKLSFDYSKKSKLRAVGILTTLYENLYFGEKGWKMSDAPKDYIEQRLEDVVAFKLEVNNIMGKSKLSQNREKQDFISVKENMKKQNKNYLFESMSNLKNE